MKRILGLVAAVVLTATLAMGASAEAVTAKLVLGFEKFEVGTKLTRNAAGEYDDSLAWEDYKDKDVGKWSATVEADGGQSGQALKLTTMKGEQEHYMFVKLSEDENVVDWTNGTDLYFYVDATGWEAAQIGLRLNVKSGDSDVQFVLRHERTDEATKGATDTGVAYVQDSKGNFVKVSTAKWGRAVLPANYKGWVKVPLNDTVFMPQWWGEKDNEKLSLGEVVAIGMHVQSDTDKDKTLTVDSFAVGGLADGNVTIDGAGNADTNGGNNNTNTNKPTNQGATTGEAGIPALLLVALPVSAGVVFACKKRSK